MTDGQHFALEQVKDIEAASGGTLELLSHTDRKSGDLEVEVSVYCGDMPHADGGLPLHDRERLVIRIPSGFPFQMPTVYTRHDRFAGFPHVQWRRSLCLYQAPSTEWDPSDGMFGFMRRLDEWLRQGAVGELDPTGAPLHPPVTYIGTGPVRSVIPRVNTPEVSERSWIGLAKLRIYSAVRVDITGWINLGSDEPGPAATAILLSQPMPFEFPDKVEDLLRELENRGITKDLLLLIFQIAVLKNEEGLPLYVVLGAPMRGRRGSGQTRQHITAWYIDPIMVKGLRLSLLQFSANEKLQELGVKAREIILDWAKEANVSWCAVREDRPEIVTRRDKDSPIAWFAGRVVSVWGCGALGGQVAEMLTRAGVRKLILRDSGIVAPGLLARQLFEDADIGRSKTEALARRLRAIRPEIEIEEYKSDIVSSVLDSPDWTDGAEVVIDTTASVSVADKLETQRVQLEDKRAHVISMVAGPNAHRGLVVIALSDHCGGISDVSRRAKIEVCNRDWLRHYADEFWAIGRNRNTFQPEPGCSDPTFVGSAADVAGLAAVLLNQAAVDLNKHNDFMASAHFVAHPHVARETREQDSADFCWVADHVANDPEAEYEVRISQSAWDEMLAWRRTSSRMSGPRVETGGILFGERDDASRVVWVTEVSGPPSDSEASAAGFVCGVVGMSEANAEKRARTRYAVQCIGTWHTHPDGVPLPSHIDFAAMTRIVNAGDPPTPRSLLLIVGGSEQEPLFASYLFSRKDFSEPAEDARLRVCELRIPRRNPKPRNVGLALSGGGARAIAFHSGCLRALHDRGVLDRVRVVSAVSGGAVIAALYAYSRDSFTEFEQRVAQLLRRGLLGRIARKALLSPHLVGSLATAAASGSAALAADIIRLTLATGSNLVQIKSRNWTERVKRIQPPFRRWISRTTAFEAVLREHLFGDARLTNARRNDLDVVLNTCELRTGSAFRFGSQESGCWRFGKLADNNIAVAQAVAASAAYPLFLPAIDRGLDFLDHTGRRTKHRVLLTDGGVFDNLGVTCLEPGRSAEVSSNVFDLDYLICCDAGPGLLSDHVYPYWWPTRVARAFESIFRKVQNSGYERLHRYARTGELKGILLSYLGQRDERLPYIPPDLVRREEVHDYPTDFSPMRQEDLRLLSLRGEQLTRLLITRYCPEL